MGEFATDELIDQPCDFCFMFKELIELASLKGKRPHCTLGGRACRPSSPSGFE
jgi:hypothetical protein